MKKAIDIEEKRLPLRSQCLMYGIHDFFRNSFNILFDEIDLIRSYPKFLPLPFVHFRNHMLGIGEKEVLQCHLTF